MRTSGVHELERRRALRAVELEGQAVVAAYEAARDAGDEALAAQLEEQFEDLAIARVVIDRSRVPEGVDGREDAEAFFGRIGYAAVLDHAEVIALDERIAGRTMVHDDAYVDAGGPQAPR